MYIDRSSHIFWIAVLAIHLGCSPLSDVEDSHGQTAMGQDEKATGEIVGRVAAPTKMAPMESELQPVAGAVVYLVDSSDDKAVAPEEPVVLKVKNRTVIPSYSVVVVGQSLVIEPIDDEQYNFHVVSPREPKSGALLPPSDRLEVVFNKPTDVVFIGCSIHPSVKGYVTVVPTTNYARSKEDGAFALPARLPPGRYEVRAFHPQFGRAARATTLVRDTKPERIELILPAPK